jgi:hypothetical protein
MRSGFRNGITVRVGSMPAGDKNADNYQTKIEIKIKCRKIPFSS